MARGPERAAHQLSASRERGGVPLIEVVNLIVEFGAQRALDHVSLSLRSGEIVGLVGANGAGKSTLGRVLVGEIQYGDFRGELRLKGKEICFFDSQYAHNSGVTLIHPEGAAIDELSVGE